MGDMKFVDTMINDGLWDAFNGYHMGTTAENVARQWQITREEQDRFAVASQNKAEAAQKAGGSRTRSCRSTIKTRKGEVRGRPTTSTSAHGATSRPWQAEARPSTRKAP